MENTPVHEIHNPDLLKIIPLSSKRIVEVGCSSGALAREVKKIIPHSEYNGIEIDKNFVPLAKRYCDEVYLSNIENMDPYLWNKFYEVDCWIFGDSLEHLQNPWEILAKIRTLIAPWGCIACCIPNAQHWSLQVKLCTGEFWYEESGLLDKTHLRWFTKKTLFELFRSSGFRIETITSRIFEEPGRDEFLTLLQRVAKRAGIDSASAMIDSIPMQYVILAKPN